MFNYFTQNWGYPLQFFAVPFLSVYETINPSPSAAEIVRSPISHTRVYELYVIYQSVTGAIIGAFTIL